MKEIDSYLIQGADSSSRKGKYLTIRALVCGEPPESGDFTVFPSGKLLRVKECRRNETGNEVILTVKGLAASWFKRGTVLLPREMGAGEGRTALIAWMGTPPSGSGMEVTLRDLPGYRAAGRASVDKEGRFTQIKCASTFIQIPGSIYRVESRDTKGEGVLIMAEPFSSEQVAQMIQRAGKFGNFPGPDSIYSMNLRIRGYAYLPPAMRKTEFEGVSRIGDWAVMSRIGDRSLTTIEKRSRSEGGIREADLPDLLKLPEELVRTMTAHLCSEEKIYRHKGFLLNRSGTPEQFLSPMTRSLLESLRAAGAEGMNMKEAGPRSGGVEALERRGLIRILEGSLFSEEGYGLLKEQVLALIPDEGSFELGDLTGKSDLGRSRLLALLEEMEKDGILRGIGGNRREKVIPLPEEGK